MAVDHIYVLQLIIAYTCVGVFVSTAVITVLALLRLIEIDPGHMGKLFTILIVEIAIIGVGTFANLLKFDPRPVAERVEQATIAEARQEETASQLAATETQLERTSQALTAIESTATETVPGPATQTLPPRIYVHIPDNTVRADAEKARDVLQTRDTLVPSIQNVGQQRSPSASELRYFRQSEAAEAKKTGGSSDSRRRYRECQISARL